MACNPWCRCAATGAPPRASQESETIDFIDEFGIHDKADEVLGEDWEAENDIEQIQQIVGDDFVVKAIEPTTKREERMDAVYRGEGMKATII